MNNMKNLGKGIGGAILTIAVVFGIYAATGTTAQAQYQNDRDGQYHRHDGNREDNQDRNWDWRRDRNRDNNQADNRNWRRDRDQDRDRRYSRDRRNDDYGNRNYGRNGGYGNNRGYGGYNNANQIALNQGYQAGLNTGANDAQRGQSFNPERSHYYRNASSQAFRQGFVRGYDEGYRQYSGYGNGRDRSGAGGILGGLGGIFGRP